MAKKFKAFIAVVLIAVLGSVLLTSPVLADFGDFHPLASSPEITTVKSNTETDVGDVIVVNVECPEDTYATGGGYELHTAFASAAEYVTASVPLGDFDGGNPAGWHLAINTTNNSFQASAYAICVEVTS